MRSVALSVLLSLAVLQAFSQEKYDYLKDIRPLLATKCFKCHNTNVEKGGVNLDNYKETERVIAEGAVWLKVLEEIKSRQMPPKSEPPLSPEVYSRLVEGINQVLQTSLEQKNPGHVIIRRLSHTEYRYTVLDLLGVDFDAKEFFPSDGSGGGGFDNQGRALFFTPLKLERYYDAADSIVSQVYRDKSLWTRIVPEPYDPSWWNRFTDWVASVFGDDKPKHSPERVAESMIVPFGTRAYRRFLKDDEKNRLITTFRDVYDHLDGVENPQRFDESMKQLVKSMLISPLFLYRSEEEPENEKSYAISNFEVANRLSYFLWSSMPDQELFRLAYAGKLADTVVLEAQVRRMLNDPRAKRFAESFATQWLGINKLLENQPILDLDKYPDFGVPVRKALYSETVEYFYHVLTRSKNMMDLVSSNYTFLNSELAAYYRIDNVTGTEFRKVELSDPTRGGVLGMGSVLAVTSLPTRTSPVLRGKWVMEQIMGVSPPPPPPEAGKLNEEEAEKGEVGLRRLLERHRSNPSCMPCHQKMDPLGLGLENFDASGRWRNSYGKVAIDASGVLATGESFNGPAELKQLLILEKEKIARNLSSKMLSYALGRSVLFTDEPVLRRLQTSLIENNFNPELMLIEIVKSYPFRMKVNDFEKKQQVI